MSDIAFYILLSVVGCAIIGFMFDVICTLVDFFSDDPLKEFKRRKKDK